MKLEGRLYKANIMFREATVTGNTEGIRLTVALERCLVDLCHVLEVPVPLWLEKNTHEFARFHQTIFFADQFTERFDYDRFQIRWLE